MNSESAPQTPADALAVVLFTAGGFRVCLEARRVAELLQPAPRQDIDDFETLFGLPPAARGLQATPQIMRLHDPAADVLVRGPVELVRLPVARIHPLPPLLAARTGLRGLCALAILVYAGEESLALLFDPSLAPCPASKTEPRLAAGNTGPAADMFGP